MILAPYGLSGVITGQTYKQNDPTSSRLLEEWRQFFIMRDPDYNPDGHPRIPPFVEVIVCEYTSWFKYNPKCIENKLKW